MSRNEEKLTEFTVNGQSLPVRFVETTEVKAGVTCDVYQFEGDGTKDLAIVTVRKGCKTPLQRVLKGDETREGFVSGQGVLTVWPAEGAATEYPFDAAADSVAVGVGERMQWYADGDTDLVFSEVCTPPYEDGRFENLTD